MSAARSAVFAMLWFSVCASAQTRTLAVYAGEARGIDSISRHSLETELQRVMTPAGIDIVWRSGTDSGAAEPGYIVVGSFSGECSAERTAQAGFSVQKALADTAVQNERILPYFRVDCGRLLSQLSPLLGRVSAPLRADLLGRAMARVIAHEIYHILAQTPEHAHDGLAKPQFSLKDLTATRFDLNSASLHRLQAAVGGTSPARPRVPASLD